LPSTAAQNVALGHDTDSKRYPLSTRVGDDHDVPSKVMAFPLMSTAAQNDELAQDTPPLMTVVPSIELGADQDVPL
jgi:hypothetical protein